jgi:hypothetical protein
MWKYLTAAPLGLVLLSTFTVGVSTLTGVRIGSLILHSKSDLLQMTPTDF